MARSFVPLHLHSFYSLLDGLSPTEAYVAKAAEQGCPAAALTDHGVMHGAIDFYKACKARGIKPILGCEVYVAFNKLTDKRAQIDNKRTHLILLCETQEGYRNLLEMTTVAHLQGYYYKPRIDWDLLKKHSSGLIALSGCLQSDLSQAVLNGDEERIKQVMERFLSIFGKDRFFLELQDHPTIPQQKIVNDRLISLSKEWGVPLVATGDSHYVEPTDNVAQDIMICIQSAKNIDDPGRLTMMNADYSMRGPEEMYRVFAHVPEAVENTLKIAERCNVSFDFGKPHLPVFPTPDGKDPAAYLRELCVGGVKEKYGKHATDPEITQRLDYELGVITTMGFVGYFLIVWDFVKWAKSRGIVVGPGRGSAAGSIVSYALDITELDPLQYGLLFERFLNPARISMPDIDLDFADDRRDEVLEYVTQKYGRDRVAQICTFGTLAARAAVKDVGRVLGVPFSEMNEFAKLIPERPGTKLADAIESQPELRQAIEKSETFQKIIENALKLEGAVRHVSVHACAVVIADEPLTNYTALQSAPKDEKTIITQYSAKPLEALGLLKMDFLGLKNLTLLQTALKIIERTKQKTIRLQTIPMDDRKTYALLSRGETTGVFQLESAGMKRYLKELKPAEFEDIIAMVSLYRPGPMEWIPDYIAGKHGRKKPHYPHPSLEPILKKTYGIAIYQEQILQIAQAFGGFSLGEADLLRRAIGKKIAVELSAQRDKFIAGAVKQGHAEALAVTIFDKIIEPFAEYGFNKSHGACYAMIAYQTAYLKAHFPTEFMTALLASDYGNTDRIVIEIGECEAMGIEVLPPDVNESFSNFTVVSDSVIRFGLSAIKGLGDGTVQTLIQAREAGRFKSLADFASRVPAKAVNKKNIEALAFSGAMDALGERKQLGENYEAISAFAKSAGGEAATDQAGLFDTLEPHQAPVADLKLSKVTPATAAEKLKWEKEYLGLYVSSHPLAGLKKFFERKAIPLDRLGEMAVGKPIKVGGLLTSVRKITTKRGDMMAILQIEDPFGKAEAVVFPKAYPACGDKLHQDEIVLMDGTLEERMGGRQIVVKDVTPYTPDALIALAKKEKLFTEGEKITRVSRQDTEEAEVREAEDVLQVSEGDTAPLNGPSLFAKKGARPLVVNREVTKAFFPELKALLSRYPGADAVELVIGDRVLPLPLRVAWSEVLVAEFEALLKTHAA